METPERPAIVRKPERLAVKRPDKRMRTYLLGIRLTTAEREKVERAAAAQGWDEPSAWARAILLALIDAGMEIVLE